MGISIDLTKLEKRRVEIFLEIAEERLRQDHKFGVEQGKAPLSDEVLRKRIGGCTEERMAEEYEIPTQDRAKQLCEIAKGRGEDTHAHWLVEEVAEFLAATVEPERGLRLRDSRKELIQIAALAVLAIEAIDQGWTE